MPNISVRRVENPTETKIQQMTSILVDAFEGDEFVKWMVGCNTDLIPLYNELHIRMALIAGEVYVAGFGTDDVSSVAIWFGPGREINDSKDQQEFFHQFMKKLTPKARAWWDGYLPSYTEFADRVLGEGFKKASWNLALIGTAPAQQRKGLARSLIQVISDRAAESGVSITTETQTDLNVSIYEKLGFITRGELRVVGPFNRGEATLHCLVKQP